MIIQITMTKNELFLLKEMLPIWQKYADAFVFMDDDSTDGTYEYLMENKYKFNILNVLKTQQIKDNLWIESNTRQALYDEAFQYSGNIICLDSDEYLDGNITKQQLEQILETYKDTLIYLDWIQYTDQNKIRVDDKWRDHIADRIGSYSNRTAFKNAQMHSEHLPHPGKAIKISPPLLFVAHLQWLDKKTVAVKQYFWKVMDYVNTAKFGVKTTDPKEYDKSVNDFNWEYKVFDFPLKVAYNVYDKHDIENSYKFKFIKQNIKEYNIPNLNDWGMGIH
jgi:hypothetical protein